MRSIRNASSHQRMARALLTEKSLEERDPSLINLPVPLPSVPVLTPLLSPLISGEQPAAEPNPPSSQKPPTSTAPSSQPSQTSGSSSSSGSGSSSGTSSSSSGSGSGNSGSSGSSSGSSSNSSSGNNAGSGSSASSGSSEGSGSNNTSSGSSAGSGNSENSGSNNSASTGSSAGSLGSSSSNSNASPVAAASSSSSHAASSSGSLASSGTNASGIRAEAASSTGVKTSTNSVAGSDLTEHNGGVAVNVGGASVTFSDGPGVATGTGVVVGSSGATGVSSSGSSGNGSGTGDGSSSNPSGNSSTSHGLSSGAIAGIVVSCSLVLFAALIFVARRRFRARRAARLNKWQAVSSSGYDFTAAAMTSQSSGTMSQRSSFATSYDIASTLRPSNDVPEVPQMVEFRDLHSPGFMTHAQTLDHPTVLVSLTDEEEDRIRTSLYSKRSTNSDPYSNQLVLQQPPQAMTGGNANLHLLDLPPTPTSPMSVRPFTPTEMFMFPKPPRDASAINAIVDPFSDPIHVHEFEEVEVVQRPFVPSLDDETWVEAGDSVRILRVFSDGWALVEKVRTKIGKGKARASDSDVPGLIPIDCLRKAGEEFPAFLAAARRMSSIDDSEGVQK